MQFVTKSSHQCYYHVKKLELFIRVLFVWMVINALGGKHIHYTHTLADVMDNNRLMPGFKNVLLATKIKRIT